MTDLSLVQNRAAKHKTDRLSWGAVELQVTDLARSIAFWTAALGLMERDQEGPGVALGTKERTLIVLHSGAIHPAAREYTGMYHVAIGVRSQAEFSRLLARLIEKNIPVGPTDHLMAKSIYLMDPDDLEIEITLETPQRFGHFGDLTKGLTIFDTEGRPHSGRGPLDVTSELAAAQGADLAAPLADDSYLAHVHFKVANLGPALGWYETLGFERHLTLANWGFADMGAGQPNTHRLAMNVWAGPNHPPAPETMARLVRYELFAHDPAVLEATGLTRDGDALIGRDPTGVEVVLRSASN